MEARLLIVDDDPDLRLSLHEYFEREGFEVMLAASGADALNILEQSPVHVVILDVVMPGMDGVEVCREIRQRFGQTIGVVMFSEPKREPIHQTIGLEIGADHYMTKPVVTHVLLAQVRALLRIMRAQKLDNTESGWLVIDDYLRIHLKQQRVEAGSQEVHLSHLQFQLLAELLEHAGEPCTRDQLMNNVWGYEEAVNVSVVDVCVSRLRASIEPEPSNPQYILSQRGVGYKFRALDK